MQLPESPTSTLLPTPRSQLQDLPLHHSPSPQPPSTLGRRHTTQPHNAPRKLTRRRRRSVDIKPATPASDQVTISPFYPPSMDRKRQQSVSQQVRIDVIAPKAGTKRFSISKLFSRSPSKQFDPYMPPPRRETTDVSTRGCSEDSTAYPRAKSHSTLKKKTAVVSEPSRVDPVEAVPVTTTSASDNGTPDPDGIQVATASSSPAAASQPKLAAVQGPVSPPPPSPPAVHPVPESPALKSSTSGPRGALPPQQRAMTDSVVIAGAPRRERRRWSNFWKAIVKKLGLKKSSTPSSGSFSPRRGVNRSRGRSASQVGSVVETLPAVDSDDPEDNDGLRTASSAAPSRSRSNSPYMERTATAVEPHNIPLPGGESSLSLIIDEQETEMDIPETTSLHQHNHSLSSPINYSSTSFTSESPLSVPSFLPDRSATTITLPTTVGPNSTCLDLSIEEERFFSQDEEDGDATLTEEEEATPTPTPCPAAPSASTHTLQLAATTAIPEDGNDSELDEEDSPPATPRLPSASHPNQTAPQLASTPVPARPDLKRSASVPNVAPTPAPTPAKRSGPSKFLFVKHSRWRGNSTLGHELGIRMFEEQYPTIETSLAEHKKAQRTWLPPPPSATYDDDGDSIVDVDDEFEDEPIGGWKEYFEEDDYYYHDEEGYGEDEDEEDEDEEVVHHAKDVSADLTQDPNVAFCAASSCGSIASEGEEVHVAQRA